VADEERTGRIIRQSVSASENGRKCSQEEVEVARLRHGHSSIGRR
jgi:hypothetical protein